MPRELSFIHAAGSINGAGAAFALGADGRPCQLGCGNLIRLAAGDYTIDLDIPLDASECSINAQYRTAAPSMPVGGSIRDRECYGALAARGVNLIAPYGGGAAIDDAVGPWAMPMPGRTVQIQRIGAGGNVVVATITGEAMDGTAGATETINLPAVAAVYDAGAARRAFRRITRFQCGDPGAVVLALQTGDGFGIAGNIDTFIGVGPIVTGVLDVAPQVWSAARGTVVPNAALVPNGVRDYDVLFSRPSPTGAAPAIQVLHLPGGQRKRFLLGAAVDASFDFVVFRTQL